MLFLLLVVVFIGVLWGVGFVVNLLINGAASAANRRLHKRDRRRLDGGDNSV